MRHQLTQGQAQGPQQRCVDGRPSTGLTLITMFVMLLGRPDDFAEPGYFASNLVSIRIRYDVMIASNANARPQSTDIRVELTATKRAALHR